MYVILMIILLKMYSFLSRHIFIYLCIYLCFYDIHKYVYNYVYYLATAYIRRNESCCPRKVYCVISFQLHLFLLVVWWQFNTLERERAASYSRTGAADPGTPAGATDGRQRHGRDREGHPTLRSANN